MNAGNASTSARLARCLDVLRKHPGGLTTAQLARRTGSCSVHSDVAELRANRIPVDCTYEGTHGGRKRYRYTLASAVKRG